MRLLERWAARNLEEVEIQLAVVRQEERRLRKALADIAQDRLGGESAQERAIRALESDERDALLDDR